MGILYWINKLKLILLIYYRITGPVVMDFLLQKHLQTLNPNIIVFIVTSFQGYLDDAMDLKVFRFLSKPIDENRFFKSMDVALNLYKQSTEKNYLRLFR